MTLQSSTFRGTSILRAFLLLALASPSLAQIPSVTDTTFTPTPNAGHDYIEAPNETVNPANGSVSIRVGVPTVKHLGPNIPFHFAYDSSGIFYMGSQYGGGQWQQTISRFSQGGWSYTLPMLSIQDHQYTAYNTGSGYNDYTTTCDAFSDYVFQDANGGRQNLGLLTWDVSNIQCNPPGNPPVADVVGNNQSLLPSLFPYLATTDTSTFTFGSPNSVDVIDADGNDYYFGPGNTYPLSGPCTAPALCPGISTPIRVTDRNGNTWQPGVQIPTFGSNPDLVTVSGLSKPYIVNWQAVNANYSVNRTFIPLPGQDNARCSAIVSATQNGQPPIQAVSSIMLPNGQSYTFDYSNNPYGLVDKITYPNGGYIRYVWGMNPQAAFYLFNFAGPDLFIADANGNLRDAGPTVGGTCEYYYDVPAIVNRFVSYDGTDEVEEQDFSYTPTTWAPPHSSYQPVSGQWSTKMTTVITKDLVQETEHKTIYTYIPSTEPVQPNSQQSNGGVPVESLIQYYDNNGDLLETVNKTWANQRLLTSQITTMVDSNQTTGETSETDWSYDNNEMQTEKDEYDYSQPTALIPPGQPILPVHGGLLRKTISPSYTSFAPLRHIVDKPYQVKVVDLTGVAAGVTYGYDTNGNLINRSNWLDQSGTNVIPTGHTYDAHGNLHTTLDPNGNTTTYNFADTIGNSCSGAYLASIIYPTVNSITPAVSFNYNCTTGELASSKDENGQVTGQVTSYVYSAPQGCNSIDYFNRLGEIDYPDGGKVFNCYNDAGPNPSTTTTQLLNASGQTKVTTVVQDAMGHAIQSQLLSDPAGTTYTATRFDGEGHVWGSDNPYRLPIDISFGSTYYSYDGLGRKTVETAADYSTKQWSYSGTSVTYTDEASNSWTHTSDALGRLASVTEPGGLLTKYVYDALGNLTKVTQYGTSSETPRIRTFTYDELSRLVTSSNPETGVICYGTTGGAVPTVSNCASGYDLNGNLLSKTDANSMTISYTYDALNRLTTKSAPDDGSTNFIFVYDQGANGIGRLSYVYSPIFTGTSFSYDLMGHVASEGWYDFAHSTWQPGIAANYDFAGNVTSLLYPHGRFINQVWDTAGRLASVSVATPGSSPITYFQGSTGLPQYSPAGALQNATFGNGVTESFLFNSRLQPCHSMASSPTLPNNPTGGNLLDRQMFYGSTYTWNCGPSTGNNGNISQIVEGGLGSGQQQFGYDNLNRLTSAQSINRPAASTYNHLYQYDSFGNMLLNDQLHTNLAYSVDPSTNRLSLNTSDLQYYPDGSMAVSPQHTYLYSAEGYLHAIDAFQTGGYLTNGLGERSQSSIGLVMNREYVYLNGQVMADVDLSGKWTDYIYANGQKIAKADSAGALSYFLADQVGTTQMELDPRGSVLWQGQFTPFGQEILSGWTSNYIGPQPADGTSMRYKFSGKERDAESGLDNFGARYFGSNMGRFMSPDFGGPMPNSPDPVPWADFENPQTLNLYAYGLNNPVSNVDDDGHDVNVCDNNGQCHQVSNEDYQKAQQGNNGSLNVPTLDKVGSNGNGSGQFNATNITDSSGNSVGTATYISNGPTDYYANSAGLNVAGQIGATMNDPRTYAAWFGASAVGAVGLVAAGATAGELTLLGDISLTPTAGDAASAERVLAQGGRKSVERAIRTLSKRLAEHQAKVGGLEGNPGSVYKEIANFSRQIEASKSVLR